MRDSAVVTLTTGALLAIVSVVRAQLYIPPSPCPDQFSYENGQPIYGMIRFRPNGPISTLTLRTNFTVKATLPTNYIGSLEVLGQKQSILQTMLRGETLFYKVNFPVSSPLPRLTSITANGNVVCYGEPDFAGPGEVVTAISLNYMLYADGESAPPYYNQPTQTQPGFNQPSQSQPGFNQPSQSRPSFNQPGQSNPSLNRPNQSPPVFTGTFPNRNPTIIVDGQQFEINDGNLNIDDSKEPSFVINTITVSNDKNPGSINQIFPSSNGQQTNVQFTRPSPQMPSQRPMDQRPPTQPQLIPSQPIPVPQPPIPVPQQPSPAPQQPVPVPQQPVPVPQQPTPVPQQPKPIPQKPQPVPQQPQPIPQQPTTTVAPQQPNPSQCGMVSGGNDRVSLVYQGTSVSRGEWPWLIAIYVKKMGGVQYICSGSLISNKHVITAAHCAHERASVLAISMFVVKTGAFNLDSWSDAVIRGLSASHVHPDYNPATLENDILIMQLDTPVEFTPFNSPVCLWEGPTDEAFITGHRGMVVGWGLNEIRGSGQGEPRMASIPIVSTETCRASRIEFHKLTSKNTLCAGDRNGTGPCNGDSGGGLYMLWGGRWRLRGVVSVALRPVTGEAKCNLDEYVVFTDAAQYLPWIASHVT